MTVIRHRVEMVGQGQNPVCWLACASMIQRYKLGAGFNNFTLNGLDSTTTHMSNLTSQDDIEIKLHRMGFRTVGTADMRSHLRRMREPTRNRTGSVTSLRPTPRTGEERERNSTRSSESVTTLRATPRTQRRRTVHEPTVQIIISILQNFGPFILFHKSGTLNYRTSGVAERIPEDSGGGHAIVVTGINTDHNTIYFNNPWGVTGAQSSPDIDLTNPIEMVVKAVEYLERTYRIDCFAYLP